MQPTATFLKSFTRLDDLPDDDKPQVALVGRSNVGKSSLINHLTGVKGLANVSSWPGRTQQFVFFEVRKKYYLVDLPGYGFARKSREAREAFTAMITDYLQRTRMLRLAIVVIDARTGPTDLDDAMLRFLEKARIPHLMVVNKSDKLPRSAAQKLEKDLRARHAGIDVLLASAASGESRGKLLAAVERALGVDAR